VYLTASFEVGASEAPRARAAGVQRLDDHIRECRARALACEARAAATIDPLLNAEHREMADRWRHVAQCYESVVSLERFLLDAWRAKEPGIP
jgi:hypothetical protein